MNEHAQAVGWIQRAYNLSLNGEMLLKDSKYPESISAFQESIEFSIKSMFSLLKIDFKKNHKISESDFKKALKFINEDERITDITKQTHYYPRLLLFSQYWANLYLLAKYGFEQLELPSNKLFTQDEANLAKEHANECFWASKQIFIDLNISIPE